MANICAELGKKREAQENFSNALKLDPDNDRYKFHQLLWSIYTTSHYELSALESPIVLMYNSNPKNRFALVLVARLYQRLGLDNESYRRKYLEIISKLVQLDPLENWRWLYSDDSSKTIEASSFTVLADSLPTYDEQGNYACHIKKGRKIPLSRITNDTIFYTDPVNFTLEKGIAWQPTGKVEKWNLGSHFGTGGRDYVMHEYTPSPNILYEEPKGCIISYTSPFWREDNIMKSNISRQITYFETNLVIPTGKKQMYEYNTAPLYSYRTYWNQVEYKYRVYPKRKIPIASTIFLVKGSYLYNESTMENTLLGLKDSVFSRKPNLEDLFEAGRIANGMTVDMANFSISLHPLSIEFNRNSCNEHFRYGDHEIIFTDGYLTDVVRQVKK